MHSTRLIVLLPLVLAAAPLHAADPACLLFHPTVPTGSYSGSAALSGGSGGVIDRCSTFPNAQWQVSGASNALPDETIWLNAPMQGLGFWVGGKAELRLEFFLDGHLQHATGLLPLDGRRTPWWQWDGMFDQVHVRGAHVLMLHGLDLVPDEVVEPLLEPPTDEEPTHLELAAARIGDEGGGADPGLITSTVPEPATLTLLGSGLVGLAGAARRRREARRAE